LHRDENKRKSKNLKIIPMDEGIIEKNPKNKASNSKKNKSVSVYLFLILLQINFKKFIKSCLN